MRRSTTVTSTLTAGGMSWDTDLLQEFIDDSFDVPLTEEEIRDLSTTGGFAKPDDADDSEEDDVEVEVEGE